MITTISTQEPAGAGASPLRALDPMQGEHDIPITHVEGTLPPALAGTLYRIGPGHTDVFGHRDGHWFDGDGMVTGFFLQDGQARFRNRFVRTPYYLAEQAAGKRLYPGFATRRPGGFWRNLPQAMKNPANTNALPFGDRLLALWEGGRPFALDLTTLNTLGEEDFGGGLPPGSFFSAHPHRDPDGGIVNVGSLMGRKPALQARHVDPAGKARRLVRIPLDKPYMVHDFGLTPTKVVILAGPFYVDLSRMLGCLVGTRTIFDAFSWHDQEPMVVYVADRNGGSVVRYELPTAMSFHVANAFDDQGDVVIDAGLYPDDSPLRTIDAGFHGRPSVDEGGQLMRIRLRPDGTATRHLLSDAFLDFPRIHPRLETQPYRYVYASEYRKDSYMSSRILKIDTATGDTHAHDFGAQGFPSEPVFVPRPGATREDDGWVLSLVYDSSDHHSYLAVVDGQNIEQLHARLHLPFHVPLTFHGNWGEGKVGSE